MADESLAGHAMGQIPDLSIANYFVMVTDPRVDRTKHHSLHDILVLTICAVLGGADSWTDVEMFGKSKLEWFKKILELPNGIPSHDTIGRVFAMLDPTELSGCFMEWVAAVAQALTGRIVAIDGKTLRRSFDTAKGKRSIHMVTAWVSEVGLVLGQVKTEEKSNEITAIPELLKVLALKGAIVTIDAMGCQKEIVKQIVAGGADYVIGLKGNQGNLLKDVEDYFVEAERTQFMDVPHDYYETVEKDHGRIETRQYYCTSDVQWYSELGQWKGLRSFGMVKAERIVGDKTSTERRYYIGSLAGTNAREYARAVRGHWGIENGLHWVLDIAFREDDCRVREGYAAQNLAVLRHITLNLLKNEKTCKNGIAAKRKRVGWDESYMLKVLAGG